MESEIVNSQILDTSNCVDSEMAVEISDSHSFNPASHMNFQIRLQASDLESKNGIEGEEEIIQQSDNETCSSDSTCDQLSKQNLETETVISEVEEAALPPDADSGPTSNLKILSLNEHESCINVENIAMKTLNPAVPENISGTEDTENNNSLETHENSALNLSSIRFEDGTVLNLNRKCLQYPDVIKAGKILHEFLNKSRKDDTFSEILTTDQDNKDLSNIQKRQIHNLNEKCKQVERKNADLLQAVKQGEEKLNIHDANAKRAIARLQKDFESKMSELGKKCAAAESDKQASVMNYARREKELLDLRRQKEGAEQFARNAGKERDKAIAQFKALKADLSKLKNANEKKESESTVQSKENDRMKEEINSQVIKVRWAQNKLKAEVDSHKETKEKCEKMVLEIQHAKEETEQIRKNCQEMIKTYQHSEEMRSNALDIELKEKKHLLAEKEAESEELQTTLKLKNDALSQLKIQHKEMSKEFQVLKARAEYLDEESLKNALVKREYDEVLNQQKTSASEIDAKKEDIAKLEDMVKNLNSTIQNLNETLQEALVRRDAALNELVCKDRKEQELLNYTEKVSSKNTQLAVEIDEVKSKLMVQNDELLSNAQQSNALKEEIDQLKRTKEEQNATNLKTQTTMNSRLEEKERTICQLLLQLEELKDDMRTVKRKNAAAMKDLVRQLNQAHKRTENVDTLSSSSIPNSTNHSADGGSMGSRTSSISSLDRVPSYSAEGNSSSNYEHVSVPETAITGPDSQERQMLIERIVRLQQIHAKKNEKIDFLNEHVQQLVKALQKKQRLLQHYITREESGALAPLQESSEHHKRQKLTLELSMEINQKMQSVLEDTLLKNITLKESLEMLGKEVQRLTSQGNS